MKPLPLVFSDQPYLPGQTKKRTKFTDPPLFNKAKKEAKQKYLPLQPASTKPQSLKTTEYPSLPKKVPSMDLPNKETPPKGPTADPSESSQVPESVRKSFQRLFGDTLTIEKRTRNKKQYLCLPMWLYRSPLSHQPQCVLSQQKPYGNTASQMPQRRLTCRILGLSGPFPLHKETELA